MGVLEQEKQPGAQEYPQVQRPPLTQIPDPTRPRGPAHPTRTPVLPEAAASSGVSQGHCGCPGLGPGACAATSPSTRLEPLLSASAPWGGQGMLPGMRQPPTHDSSPPGGQ